MIFHADHPQTGERLKITARYYPKQRGSRDIYGAPEEPDSPEEVRIKLVEQDGRMIWFADIEEDLEQAGLEHIKRNPIGELSYD